MNFAKNLRRIRKMKHMTMEQLGDKAGITLSAIQKYEKGLSEPNLSRLIWLAESLDITVAVLIGEV